MQESSPGRIPRSRQDDYTDQMAAERRNFASAASGAALKHVGSYSLDPATLPGNVENFIGAAQVPIGLAGPLVVRGEHANGEFLVPLATTEGTLVASYNRGMRLIRECGGVMTTVVEEQMQRAPVFTFADAHQARDFGVWVNEQFAQIKAAAEATTSVGRLQGISQHSVGPLRFLRFNYTCGDAAGQNLTGKATLAACEWISAHYPSASDYLLSGNIDTDKKHSQINTLLTRGKRVIAEVVLQRERVLALMGVEPAAMFQGRQISNAGAFMAGASSNGAQAANALAALFIATGQDAANVAESHASITYTQLLDNGDYYWSITLPSLIVATYGGGTGLATQRECLELLGCYGTGKVAKFAEICAAVVLAGEISLSSAVLHGDWVASHDTFGATGPEFDVRGAYRVGMVSNDAGVSPWALMVSRDELSRTVLSERAAAPLEEGQARLAVRRVGLTANNVTYAVLGESFRYWEFFPAGPGFGIVPLWGFAEVAESRAEGVRVGERYYGYLPSASELVVLPGRVDERGFADATEYRRPLPSPYNAYTLTTADPVYDPAHEDLLVLFRPLFYTSFMLADYLQDTGFFGADVLAFSSASSKTAYSAAHLLAGTGPRVVGLTSPGNVDFTESLGVYDEVLSYDDVSGLDSALPTAYLDVSGSPRVASALRDRLGEHLVREVIIGVTSQQQSGSKGAALFFAPDQMRKRVEDWGHEGLDRAFAEAWNRFVPAATGWVDVVTSSGPQELERVWLEVLAGHTPPRTGHIIVL